MSIKKTYLIFILQYREVNFSITTFLHLHEGLKNRHDLRANCKIILATSASWNLQYKLLKKQFGALYDVDIFQCPVSYPEKLAAIFKAYPQEHYEILIKCDEDILISADSWQKFLTHSAYELKNQQTLLTTVNLSTGIPSWQYFASSFFTNDEQAVLYNQLKTAQLPVIAWQNDYTKVNEVIKGFNGNWNEAAYWDAVNEQPYYYKGIHPVRMEIFYACYINQTIANNSQRFLSYANTGCNFNYIRNRYFCNSFFAINYNLYTTVLAMQELFVDPFDEVPLNRYAQQNNLQIAFLDKSVAVHIAYNSIYKQNIICNNISMDGKTLEQYFQQLYYKNITAQIFKRGSFKYKQWNSKMFGAVEGLIKIAKPLYRKFVKK